MIDEHIPKYRAFVHFFQERLDVFNQALVILLAVNAREHVKGIFPFRERAGNDFRYR